MLQSEVREVRRLRICLHFAACPSYHISNSVTVDREIVKGSTIPAPPPCPFRTRNGLFYLSIFILASLDKENMNRSYSYIDRQGRITGFEKRGSRDFGL